MGPELFSSSRISTCHAPKSGVSKLTARLLLDLDDVLLAEKPDVVLVQGDTWLVMTATLASFYHRIPVGHVEAGPETWDIPDPFPEEANRVSRLPCVGILHRLRFAPELALKEGISDSNIPGDWKHRNRCAADCRAKPMEMGVELDPGKRLVMVTSHRRENFGEPFRNILSSPRNASQSQSGRPSSLPCSSEPERQRCRL